MQDWIASGRPLLIKGNCKKKHPLRLAIESGFHSMVEILAAAWPDKETLNEELSRTLTKKRVDLFWILLENGADMKSVYLHEVASCCDKDLMKFYLDRWDEVGGENGLYELVFARPYPLTGMIKEFAPSVPNHKQQLGKALNHFVKESSPRWIPMSAWMGADPRLPAPWSNDDEDDPDEWMASIELAVNSDTFEALKLFKPSAETDDLNKLLDRVYLWDYKDFDVAEYLLSLDASSSRNPAELGLTGFPLYFSVGSAPWSRRIFPMVRSSFMAATCRAVLPYRPCAFTSAPCASRNSAISTCPDDTAVSNGVASSTPF